MYCSSVTTSWLRIFHYSPWYTYNRLNTVPNRVENLSLFTLIYLAYSHWCYCWSWESFIIHLDILNKLPALLETLLRIFHYSPWYTYPHRIHKPRRVENLSLFTLIYLESRFRCRHHRWESFIIHLDILTRDVLMAIAPLRIFHYSPWYTYAEARTAEEQVENLSLFTLIYLRPWDSRRKLRWESFIIHLDILIRKENKPMH